MTTTTLMAGNGTMTTEKGQPRRSLEELVDRLFAAMFPEQPQTAPATETPSVTKSVHEARRMRQARDVDGALELLAGVDMARATTREARWAYTEWKQLVRRRFGDRDVVLYSQSTGRAAALAPTGHGTLEVVSALGMRWKPGKLVSRHSLRGLRPPASSTGQALGRTCP